MLDEVTGLMSFVAANFWNNYTIGMLLGTGLILTVATRFVQIRRLHEGGRLVLMGAMKKDISPEDAGDITPFQALTTALSATVGNGNIAGVATAITFGGPGAVFWMWVTAFVGMATKYSEALLSVHFRKVAPDGSMSGGPMYYISQGFRTHRHLRPFARPLAGLFAVCGAWTALFGSGNIMQSNSISLAFQTEFNIPVWVSALCIAVMVGMIILGGIRRIGEVTERLVPFMIIVYVASALLILGMNASKIPGTLWWIINSAFSPQAAVGGYAGHAVSMAIQMGVRRSMLSNEAGMGSAPIAYAAAKTHNPVNQGLIATMEVFIDTILVCTMTALVILVTNAYQIIDPSDPEMKRTLTSSALTAAAFNRGIPVIGGKTVAFSSFLFGFSTLIGWCYYGEQCMKYLFGVRVIKPYRLLFIVSSFAGALLQKEHLTIVWDIGDVSNGIMALPNLVGLLGLSGTVAAITRVSSRRVNGGKVCREEDE